MCDGWESWRCGCDSRDEPVREPGLLTSERSIYTVLFRALFYQDSGSGSIPCGGGVIFPTSTGVDPVSIGFDPSSTWVNPSSTYVYSAYTVVDPNSTGIDPTSTGIHPTSTGVEFPKFPICFSHLCEVKAAKRETHRHTTNVELKKHVKV